jgi:membrane protein DedA with SNARE-associated domain
VGSLVWTGALAWAGRALGTQYARVGAYLGPISNAVLLILVVCYVVRVARWSPDATR